MAISAGSAAASTGLAGLLRTKLAAAWGADFQATAATFKTLDAIAEAFIDHIDPEISPFVGEIKFYNGTGLANCDTRDEDVGFAVGDVVPERPNWKVCNGVNGYTPDLRGLFIRCESTAGNTGGTDTVENHQHAYPNHQHQTDIGFDTTVLFGRGDGSGKPYSGSIVETSVDRVTGTTTNTTGNVRLALTRNDGGGNTSTDGGGGENRPAYYSLILIMRVAA